MILDRPGQPGRLAQLDLLVLLGLLAIPDLLARLGLPAQLDLLV